MMRILELGVEIYLRSQRILGLEGCNLRDLSLFQKRGVCISIAGLFRQTANNSDLPIRRNGQW